ncbi:MAG: B12-binding domain-containing radical SAM protein [Candidatus Omnitrophica bacterium]|nr:B12-binding domain-containing radical SAM protein [Candidatus Omnitrophota bacterium]
MYSVILINPQIGFSPPFGLLYLGAVLERAGHKVEVVEFNSYKVNDFDPERAGLVKEVMDKGPDLIGITCLSAYSKMVKKFIGGLKRYRREIPVIAGGPHATALPESMLEAGADIVAVGEAEGTILKIVEHYQGRIGTDQIPGISYKDGSQRVRTNPRTGYEDVNKLPVPAYHLINLERYLARNFSIRGYWLRNGWVFTARGCPGQCTFCASFITHGYKIRERNLDDVVNELMFLKERYNIEGFWILDDTFTIKPDRVAEFSGKLRDTGMNLKWGCQARVNFFNERIAAELKNSGCLQVDFGVESGSQKVLDYLKKGITVAQTRRAFEACKRYNLRALATCKIGTPKETREDIEETKRLLGEIRPDYTGFFFTTPYPGTELYKEASEKKLADVSDDVNWEHYATPKFATNFTFEELHEIYNELVKDNFTRTLADYMRQPRFLLDSAKTFIFHPMESLRLFVLLCAGKREDFINKIRELRIKRKL